MKVHEGTLGFFIASDAKEVKRYQKLRTKSQLVPKLLFKKKYFNHLLDFWGGGVHSLSQQLDFICCSFEHSMSIKELLYKKNQATISDSFLVWWFWDVDPS